MSKCIKRFQTNCCFDLCDPRAQIVDAYIYNCFKVDDNRKINNDDEDIILGVQKTTKKSYGLCLKTYEYNEFPFSKEDMKAVIQIFKEYDLILKKSNAYKSTVRIYDYLKKAFLVDS